MKGKKKLFLILLTMLMVLLTVMLVACSSNGGGDDTEPDDGEDDPQIVKPITLSPSQALDKIYEGLIAGGEEISSAVSYGVSDVFTVFLNDVMNYTITYKANYKENSADSEIYIKLFDNTAYLDRLTVYYNGGDLYLDMGSNKTVVSKFGSTMLFGTFFSACRELDVTNLFFDQTAIPDIFNRDSQINLGALLYPENISYNKVGETGESIEITELELTAVNDTLNTLMKTTFRDIDQRFDVISNKLLGFNFSRIAESQFAYINAEEIRMDIKDKVVDNTRWKVSGSMYGNIPYWMEADVSYNDGKAHLAEGGDYVKSQYVEANLGRNHFVGDIVIPSVSDEPYDMSISTNINTKDNSTNKANMRIFDASGDSFVSLYYTDGTAYMDASGFYEWMGGAVDLDAFNLPKVYLSNINLAQLISAGYNNISKALLTLIEEIAWGGNGDEDDELYDKIMENFYTEGNTVYYKITEELIQSIRNDEETVMHMVAELLGMEEKQLASYIGEDFFSSAELIVGYNLDNGQISITMNHGRDTLFVATLMMEEYDGVYIPDDCNKSSAAYSNVRYPDEVTLNVKATLSVYGNVAADASATFGVFVGDTTGKNTPYSIKNNESLLIEGTVTQNILDDTEYNFIHLKVDSRVGVGANAVVTKLFEICTDPKNKREYLVSYYARIGNYDGEEGLFFRVDRETLKAGFQDLLGEGNVFDESNVLSILTTVMSLSGMSTITKANGSFNFSLASQGDNDPVFELIGIKDTMASISLSADFDGVDDDVDSAKFTRPVITPLDPATFESLYSDGSEWKDEVQVFINAKEVIMNPPYEEESVKVVTGKNIYNPTASLFGQNITYEVRILNPEGTYKIDSIVDDVIVIDPSFSDRLPERIQVRYDNNTFGYLPCSFDGFAESNITPAGYNLPGFADRLDLCTKSKITLGRNSIMHTELEVYILVNNRTVYPYKNNIGTELYAPNNVPVVGVIEIDPYTYAMIKSENEGYDPILSEIDRQNMVLRFNNVYGQEEVAEGDEIVVRDLVYDYEGVNYFYLKDLGLEWQYDNEITWRGSFGYAYATFGAEDIGTKIAIQVKVSAQEVESVKIDEETNGQYTIDFLRKDTYTIPAQSGLNHDLYLYFVTGSAGTEKRRKLVISRPANITDEDYYANYVLGSMNWDGAEYISTHPEVITVNGVSNLFSFLGRNDNRTTAIFGERLSVGTQTVNLNVNVPTRYQSAINEKGVNAATLCTIDEESGMPIYGNKTEVKVSPASFGADYEVYQSYGINPYDTVARLPDTILLTVARGANAREEAFYDSEGNLSASIATVKEYNVQWVTTDNNGNELNFIEEKEDGGFGLKNPVVSKQDFVVYGRVGDRGAVSDSSNVGYVWVKMIVTNLASSLTSVKFDDKPIEEINVEIDPYLPYVLPTTFEAELENGNVVRAEDLTWSVQKKGDATWYPIIYEEGYDATYYENGKFLFSYLGGDYVIKYTLEGNSEVIKQEITLAVKALDRVVITNGDGRAYLDVFGGDDFSYGYQDINNYNNFSTSLLDRLERTVSGEKISVAFGKALDEDGRYIPYSLPVRWTREGEGNDEQSIDRLFSLLRSEPDGTGMVLSGKIGAGTVNEQTIEVEFNFLRLIVDTVSLENIYLAMEEGAITVDEGVDGEIDFRELPVVDGKKVINIRIHKPFLLKNGDKKDSPYASPYDYVTYLFGELNIKYENGTVMTTNPSFTYLDYEDRATAFNHKVLDGEVDETTFVAVELRKLSAGSALQGVVVNIHTTVDERIDDSAEPPVELFDETSNELYGSVYPLPTAVQVNYKNSGTVTYTVAEWNIEATTMSFFGGATTATGIPVSLINTLRREGDDSSNKQLGSYSFFFRLPCEDADFNITIRIPKKNLNLTAYNAKDEAGLYNIENGILTIDNPYLYYDATSEYGFDTTKIPYILKGIPTGEYLSTDNNEHYVSWEFIKGVFDPKLFPMGIEKAKIATAKLPAYYDSNGNKQSQTVELYVSVKAMPYYGISYGEMPVISGADGQQNVITVDPYNDVMGYKGTFTLPTVGLTVLFDSGNASFVFGQQNDPIKYKLYKEDGTPVDDRYVTEIKYDETGHLVEAEGVGDILDIRAIIPGYEHGIAIKLDIQSRIIETVKISNYVFENGIYVGDKLLEDLYYIDPYNTATFGLPIEAEVKFREKEDFESQSIAGWEIYSNGSWVSLDSEENFYSKQNADKTSYGYYKATSASYEGGTYRLRGSISLGFTSTGAVGKQTFEIDVVVLNRSLKEEYVTYYRYDDPLGGLLSDIPSTLTEDMFVDYDRYYSDLKISEGDFYSAWSTPVLPTVNWGIENYESTVDYRGDFDKEIKGNVYYGNTNTAVLDTVLGAENTARYEQLIRSRMWDGYFTASGAPQTDYSDTTKEKLINRRIEFEDEVVFAVYEKVVAIYSAGTDTERQYANYLTNSLTNQVVAENNLDKRNDKEKIAHEIFNRLKSSDTAMDVAIYTFWQKKYDDFVAEDDEYDVNLSEYMSLKAKKYNDIAKEDNFFSTTEQSGYNARLRSKIENSLRVYSNASLWDAIYDRVTSTERAVMDSILKGTDVTAKANALTLYRGYTSANLGSAGEEARANITAPALSIGGIVEKDEGGNVIGYKEEFIFNAYSSISFIENVDVEFIYNFYPLLVKHIDEGVKIAMEEIRESNKGQSLTDYVTRVVSDYVNTIIPTKYNDDDLSLEEKILDFEYSYGKFNEEDNNYSDYWDTLYQYKLTKAVEHIAKLSGSTAEERWNNAYKAHELKGETAITAAMTEIKDSYAGSSYNYDDMIDRYKVYLQTEATKEMDGYYAEAMKDANVYIIDLIMANKTDVLEITGITGGAAGAFQGMFDDIADGIYDKLEASYSTGSPERKELADSFNAPNGGNSVSKARAVFYAMTSNAGDVSDGLKERASNMFYAALGGGDAYATLLNNLSRVNLDTDYLNRIIEVAVDSTDGAVNADYLNGALSGAEYEAYKNYCYVKGVLDALNGDTRQEEVKGWINDAIRDAYADGFERLLAKHTVADRQTFVEVRERIYPIERSAFVYYVKAYETTALEEMEIVEESKTAEQDRVIFDNSKLIANSLATNDRFVHASLFVPNDGEIAGYKEEALDYLVENIVDNSGKATIEYARYLYGESAYDMLALRTDLSATFLSDLENAYYYVLIEDGLEKAERAVMTREVTEADKSTSAFRTMDRNVRAMFVAIALPAGKNTFVNPQSEAIVSAEVNRQYLKRSVYAQEILPYTELVNSLATNYKKDIESAVYDGLYVGNEAIFDAILETYVAKSNVLYTNAYKYFEQSLIADETVYLLIAEGKVAEEVASASVFDGLGVYSLTATDGEKQAKIFVQNVKAVFDTLTEEVKNGLNNVFPVDIFAEESYLSQAERVIDGYSALLSVTDAELAAGVDTLCKAIEVSAVMPADTEYEKVITDGIKNAVGQVGYKKYEGTKESYVSTTKVASYSAYLDLLRILDGKKKAIDVELLTEENIAGNFTVTTDGYKDAYVTALLDVLAVGTDGVTFSSARQVIAEAISTEESRLNGQFRLQSYGEYEQSIKDKMMMTAAFSDLFDTEGEPISLATYVAGKSGYVKSLLVDRFVAMFESEPNENERAKLIFEAMKNDVESLVTFTAEDRVENDDDYRHVIAFSENALPEGTVEAKAPVYVGNKYKIEESVTNAHKIDAISYRYLQVEIKYVDFTGKATVDNIGSYADRNYLEIDPLAPELPETVHAYGEYTVVGTDTTIPYDIGDVSVKYGETFRNNIYDGQDKEVLSYSLTFVDKNGNSFDLPIGVKYHNRTVARVYLESEAYGGNKIVEFGSELDGLVDIFDESRNKNVLSVNPINESVLDVENRRYSLPDVARIVFADEDNTMIGLSDIVWDMTGVNYTLSGQTGIEMRILSYVVELADGTARNVEFDYVSDTVTISLRDENGSIVTAQTYNSTPGASIWNILLDVDDKSVSAVSIRETVGNDEVTTVLGSQKAGANYVDAEVGKYHLNPFDIVFPEKYFITFSDGTVTDDVEEGNWRLESGANGSYKIRDIILGSAGDQLVMTEFDYLGYVIKVRFTADSIKLEGLEDDEFYDGGTLYLVKGGGSVFEQLEKNYSYFYYNFSDIATQPDYRRVPLSFIDGDVGMITTETENVTNEVRGVLGWDKKAYPSGVMSPNILFTIAVIDPKIYGEIDGEINPYVVLDYLSIPYDGNLQKRNDANEPTVAEYFVKIEDEGETVRFPINTDTVSYDILNDTITYECVYTMTSGFGRLFSDAEGNREISFSVTMPLSSYLYTDITGVTFDRTPVQDLKGDNIWKWTSISEDSLSYRDGIVWTLGREMRASYLPKGINGNGESIALLWDLDDINVNSASSNTPNGYYVAKGYYYSSEGNWECKELAIYINKYDATENIVSTLGGSQNIVTVYDGQYYELPLDLTAETMLMLREDGTRAALTADSVSIEYKLESEEDRRFSEDNYPLNAGTYTVRVTVTDTNVTAELDFRLIINPVRINPDNIKFLGEVSNMVGYVYDGNSKGLVVTEGLPKVMVDNWFYSREEKEALVNKHVAEGYDTVTAKSRAYSELYGRVTPATKRYLDGLKATAKAESGLGEGDSLNALLFDRLTHSLEITEVVANVVYVGGNDILDGEPIDVGTYNARYTILAHDVLDAEGNVVQKGNNGNYVFNDNQTLVRVIEIAQPDVSYNVSETELVYNGSFQNPRIDGLHDADGNLPNGVTVTYEYSTGAGNVQYFTNGIKNLGVYNCTVTIDGGKNYPDGSIANKQVSIIAKDLYIDIEEGRSEYLSQIVDVTGKAVFNGLSGTDVPSVFGVADITTETKDYFVPGVYGIFINGFALTKGGVNYTEIDKTDSKEVDGKTYYRMYLLPAGKEGSLYNQVNEQGFVYAELINLIGSKGTPGNYSVYVVEKGDYTVYVNTEVSEKVFIVNSDAELNAALAEIKDGDRVRIYLSSPDMTKITYNAVTMNVNASVTIVGCYDENKNVITYVDGIAVQRGSLTLRIVGFSEEADGEVSVKVGRNAGAVNIHDSIFVGNGHTGTVGLMVEAGYANKVMADNSSFDRYQQGILTHGGNAEVVSCVFTNNKTGVQILGDGTDIQIRACEFAANDTGLMVDNLTANVLNNTFTANRLAVYAPGRDTTGILIQNVFDETNNEFVRG